MASDQAIRDHLADLLDWREAHVGLEDAVRAFPPEHYATVPDGLPYSAWQLLSHLRFTQHDILEFCRNPDYVEPKWPDDYWPDEPGPSDPREWAECLVQIRADRMAMQELVRNSGIGLDDQVPHGTGQTYLREVLLLADHTAYHLGQLVSLRRLLGAWPPPGV